MKDEEFWTHVDMSVELAYDKEISELRSALQQAQNELARYTRMAVEAAELAEHYRMENRQQQVEARDWKRSSEIADEVGAQRARELQQAQARIEELEHLLEARSFTASMRRAEAAEAEVERLKEENDRLKRERDTALDAILADNATLTVARDYKSLLQVLRACVEAGRQMRREMVVADAWDETVALARPLLGEATEVKE